MSTSRFSPGTTIGERYVLDRMLGEGSFGQVWAATDSRAFNRRVAVKVLMDEHLANPDIVSRFQREGEATAALNHPNVVSLLEFGRENGIPYLISEFVPGRTLRKVLEDALEQKEFLPLDVCQSLFRQLCAGVGAAHSKGIVHRDLKPENVMVQGDGLEATVKVLDFGIARILGGNTGNAAQGAGRTEAGRILGSLQYMSPEQVLGDIERIGPATDVFALGAILYELFTLHPVFDAPAFHQIVSQIISAPRPHLEHGRPGLPAALDEVVQRALATDPSGRYPDARALAVAVDESAREPLELTHGVRASQRPPPEGEAAVPLALKGTLEASLGPGKTPVHLRPQPVGAAAKAHSVPPPEEAALPSLPAPAPTPPSRAPLLGLGVLAVLLAAGGAWFAFLRPPSAGNATSHPPPPPVAAPPPPPAPLAQGPQPEAGVAPEAAVAAAPRPETSPEDWVRIEAPAQPVTLGRRGTDPVGFTAAAQVRFAGPGFSLMAREVTWRAYERWSAGRPEAQVYPPSWVAREPAARAALPVSNVPWELARAYCRALDGDLPTEEQWEYAVRGPSERENPWSAHAPHAGLNVFRGVEGTAHAPGADLGDRTAEGVFDLAGNVLEWTSSRYRTDEGDSPAWTVALRTIRGLPLRERRPSRLPAVAPFRNSGCIGSDCNAADRVLIESVGFRCARPLS